MKRCTHPGRGPRGGMCCDCRRVSSAARTRRYAQRHPDRVEQQKADYDRKTTPVNFRVDSDVHRAFVAIVGHYKTSAAVERFMREVVRMNQRRTA